MKKIIIISAVLVVLACIGIIAAQKQSTRNSDRELYGNIFAAQTKADRKQLFRKLTPRQRAEIWKLDLLTKSKVYGYEGTPKGQILVDLSDAFFPDLFDVSKTAGKPQEGEFAERPEAKRFFEIMGRYANSFSPEETKNICAILGNPTDPATEKAAKDAAGPQPDALACECSFDSSCTACWNYCRSGSCLKSSDGCGCFWYFACTGVCE